jgi:hypothetical protein
MLKMTGYTIDLGISKNQILNEYWIPECEGLWFKPVKLDAIHSSYTGYWYADRNNSGSYHYHSGATQLISLHGSTRFTNLNNEIITVNSGQYVYVPSGVTHKADIELDANGFLFYGTIESVINYLDDELRFKSKFDVFDYIEMIEKHYLDNQLDVTMLDKIIVR